MSAIGRCKKLKELSVGDKSRPIEAAAITHLLPILPNLEVLDLILFDTVSLAKLIPLQIIINTKFPQLNDEAVKSILTAGTKLQKLKLPPGISDKAFELKTPGTNSPLKYLNVLTTKVTDAGVEMMIGNYPNMELFKAPPQITINST